MITHTKLFVGNLSASVTENTLQNLFSQQGPVAEVRLMMERTTGRSRGFALVTMSTPEGAQAALQVLHSHSLGGRYITVNEALPQPEQAVRSAGAGPDGGRLAASLQSISEQKMDLL